MIVVVTLLPVARDAAVDGPLEEFAFGNVDEDGMQCRVPLVDAGAVRFDDSRTSADNLNETIARATSALGDLDSAVSRIHRRLAQA
jgi:hypothetical protein